MTWLSEFRQLAAQTDQLTSKPDHASLLAAGLVGEVGGILAELKKAAREEEAYPAHKNNLTEELGDALWYFVRFAEVLCPSVLNAVATDRHDATNSCEPVLQVALGLGAEVGRVVDSIETLRDLDDRLLAVWDSLSAVARASTITLKDAAEANESKIASRWPTEREPHELFDEDYPIFEQLPRALDVDFIERDSTVLLRCNGLNFGDRIKDNIGDADFYRYHDIFHFAHAAYLGWSPVLRALLRCKRKSRPAIDESEDSARAGLIEEAISAIVFSRVRHLNFLDGIDHLDYDLLKTVSEFVEGYEVSSVPHWQWEEAILNGYRVFRQLRAHSGGLVKFNLITRTLDYSQPTASSS